MPTSPPLVMTKFVAVEEPTTNAGPVIPFGFIENCPHGEVVPMPTLPPIKLAEMGFNWVVLAINTERGPRNITPPKPTLIASKFP